MKRTIAAVALCTLLVGCADDRVVNGKNCTSYGLLNRDDKKVQGVAYKTVTGNIVWSVLLSSTIVAPIYFLGFSLYEPIGPE